MICNCLVQQYTTPDAYVKKPRTDFANINQQRLLVFGVVIWLVFLLAM
jgi:hypothetical protein